MGGPAQKLGERIKSRRKLLGLNQKDLAKLAGFPVHQMVSQIEKGQRGVKAWELGRLAQALRVSISDLLAEGDLAPAPTILWRNQPAEDRELWEARFLEYCRRYAHVASIAGTETSRPLQQISVDLARFGWNNARDLAHDVSKHLGLGNRPAASLASILEERCGVQIWHLDLGKAGSAACVVGDFGSAILMNSREAPWRRNFNFGHELFHILTWQSIPPSDLQGNSALSEQVEKLANAFASSLLLPSELIIQEFDRRVHENAISCGDLIDLAREFEVSTEALVWRLVTLRLLAKGVAEKLLTDEQFRTHDRASMPSKWWEPPPLPGRFVRLSFLAHQKGKLSRSRLAQYLDTSLPDLPGRLMEYGLDEAADYGTAVPTA